MPHEGDQSSVSLDSSPVLLGPLSGGDGDLAVATVLVFGDHETVAVVLVLAAFGVAIWYQVRKGRKKSAVKLALWLALLIVLWWFGTGHGPTPPPH